MAYSLRKIQVVITTLVMIATGSVQGSDDNSSAYSSAPCATQSCCPASCGRFFLGAELLYLRAYEGGFANVCDGTRITESHKHGKVISRLEGRAHEPDFKWNLGYRIGAGYEFANSNCGIGVIWTHYNSDSGDRSHRNKQNWRIDFDVVDVIYGCECNWSTCFDLTPYAGLRYATIEQKLRSHFESIGQKNHCGSHCGSHGNTRSTRHLKEDFFGVGPLFGLEGDWRLGCQFSLYGDISVAFLYGTYHVHSNRTDEFKTGTNINHIRKHLQACQYVVDAGFGVRWKTCFCCDKILMVQLGVEEHRYFNHNQFCGYGDLSLNGVSLGVGVEF